MNILLADDDAISRKLLGLILKPEPQHVVTTANDGCEAWQLLCAPNLRFDLAILDVVMPCLDGIQLLGKIRRAPTLSTMPVILCSAANDRMTVKRAALLSVSGYIIKPFNSTLVLEKIRAIETELATAPALEATAVVCTRLGVDGATYRQLIDALLIDLRNWIGALRRLPVELQNTEQLGIRANSLKGGCLSLGAREMGGLLGRFEVQLTRELAGEHRKYFSLTSTELSDVLSPFESALARLESVLAARAA